MAACCVLRLNSFLLRTTSSAAIGRRMMMSSSTSSSTNNPSGPTLLQRIQALDKSSLAPSYTALVLFHPSPSSQYAVVGHVQNSLIKSTLINCKNDQGEPIFVLEEKLSNQLGTVRDILRLNVDVQYERNNTNDDAYEPAELFQRRTESFAQVTKKVISRQHSDIYPVYPFVERMDPVNDNNVILAHVNRSTAPYLGIDSVGVHLNCYVRQNNVIQGVWLAKRASTKSHHPNYWDTTVAGGQPHNLSLYDNIVKEAHEEAGVPSEWLRNDASNKAFSDHTHDPLTMTTAKEDGSCMKRSFYYSFDLQVPDEWQPTPVDGEVQEFKLYSIEELDRELRFGQSLRPAMRAVLLDFMIRHGLFKEIEGEDDCSELSKAMRRERIRLW
eukprot:scaffold11242_cov80-Skeletonema_dohrnii-CCMP3373.AAC.2